MRRFAAGLVLASLLAACGQADMADQAPMEESAGGYAQRVQGGEMPTGWPEPAPPQNDA